MTNDTVLEQALRNCEDAALVESQRLVALARGERPPATRMDEEDVRKLSQLHRALTRGWQVRMNVLNQMEPERFAEEVIQSMAQEAERLERVANPAPKAKARKR